jgi:hypothetical protein
MEDVLVSDAMDLAFHLGKDFPADVPPTELKLDRHYGL